MTHITLDQAGNEFDTAFTRDRGTVATYPENVSIVDRDGMHLALRQWLITNIAAALEIDPATIDVERNLDELGLDSLQSVCLAGDLESWLGREIPPTAIWDYPTIESLCRYLNRPGLC
jgi:acyl carrier protein